jgi:glycosyltransferase involved in cell wall biosynthesis
MRRFRPDVVHTHLTKSDAVGLAAAVLAGAPARISTVHSADPRLERLPWRTAFAAILRCAHRVVAVSPAVREHLRRFVGLGEPRVTVIPNSVDVGRFDSSFVAMRQEPPPERPRVVGIIGRLVPEKGHDDLLRAFSRIRARRGGVELEIVGEGPLRDRLERQAEELGLAAHVRFTGFVDDIAGVLRRIDVLAMPSRFEGLPLALLEGMAAALPIVAARVGGIPDAVTDGEHGLLVPAGDVPALAAAIGDLLDDRPKAILLGRTARTRAEREFDRRVAHEKVVQLYQAVLSEHASS